MHSGPREGVMLSSRALARLGDITRLSENEKDVFFKVFKVVVEGGRRESVEKWGNCD